MIQSKPTFWKEPAYQSSLTLTPVEKVLAETKSEFQDLKIVELKGLGRTLLCDLFTQSSEKDEKVYHEALVHVAMLQHPCPRTVFVGGGGEGGTVREVLKYKSVERVVMVDIDEKLVNLCRQHLPEWGDTAWEDKRLEIHYEDAREYLIRCKKEHNQQFDVVIMDICDPTRDSMAVKLYEQEFYQELKTNGVLNEGFVLVTQSGPGGFCSVQEVGTVIHHTLSKAFNFVIPYTTHISSFFDQWSFNLAYDSKIYSDPRQRIPTEINQELVKRLDPKSLTFYDGLCHQGIFGLPKCISLLYEQEKRIITATSPISMNENYDVLTGTFTS